MKIAEYKQLVQPKEHQIMTEIMNYLKGKGYYCMRLNSGKYSVGEGRSKRFINGQEAGTPDLMAFLDHRENLGCLEYGCVDRVVDLFFIEVKRPKGIVTERQKNKMKELEEYGARCFVAHSVEEVQSLL